MDYDRAVSIRDMKNIAVLNSQDKFIDKITAVPLVGNKKVAVIGAGAAGLAVALYLRRNGLDVTVMEKREKPYGVIQYVIPEFRISQDMIDKDFKLVKSYGVNFKFGVDEDFNLKKLKENYDYIVLALGAWKPLKVNIDDVNRKAINALEFLESFKTDNDNISLGKHVCVIGGGDVAMDAARAAKRVNGVSDVTVVYRRTKDLMPASKEEIDLLISEGIIIKELLSPKEIAEGNLICNKMILGEKDSSGRRKPMETDEQMVLPADTVILAVGDTIDNSALVKNNIELDERGYAKLDCNYQTSIDNVYVAGDFKSGPSTIVQAIADSKTVAKKILEQEGITPDFVNYELPFDKNKLYLKKGVLSDELPGEEEALRCLACNDICELCVDVCPNRANMLIKLSSPDMDAHQILHIDGMCNECGNCGVFCPYNGNPYKDKITLFWTEEEFNNSKNRGFFIKDINDGLCIVRNENNEIIDYTIGDKNVISKEYEKIIEECIKNYRYII